MLLLITMIFDMPQMYCNLLVIAENVTDHDICFPVTDAFTVQI